MTGEALCVLVSQNMLDKNIAINKCIGSSIDDTLNMIGQYKEFLIWLEKESSNKIYVWCYAHCLNLLILETNTISTPAISLFGLLNSCATFFKNLHKIMDIGRLVTNNSRVLNLIGQIRW